MHRPFECMISRVPEFSRSKPLLSLVESIQLRRSQRMYLTSRDLTRLAYGGSISVDKARDKVQRDLCFSFSMPELVVGRATARTNRCG